MHTSPICYSSYRPTFEYATGTHETYTQPSADQKKRISTTSNNSNKNTTTSANDEGQDVFNSNRPKHASASVGNRLLSAFRSTTHHKGDNVVHVKTVSAPNPSPATYPAARPQSEMGGKPGLANIFSSIGSAGTFTTAEGDDGVSELAHGESRGLERENTLSDSGLGQSPARTQDGKEKPVNPEEVLKRSQEPTRPVNAIKLIAGEPPTTSSKALERLIGIPAETPAKAVSTLTGMFPYIY